ncbi:VOC family protein [Fulvivirga sedimenti]|uniref:VOC family protein n=1 Tax=Fulvivirga sedimenti TaxID=2879465 RepID=A0A9X1KZJ7_9BACT|nr:VOC family protein [Fulvivirga sedimenti]MCA6075100.1 VOC family protein [Fulvivirga sedimenti]MCA6076277.1 VOC family protein [Fulvivirga sedimenti]MCA6077405.1 VOC family protein [Fulvivirga sedimenti]
MEIINCNLTIMVHSLEASIRFYTETLGFTLKHRFGNNWADIEGPGINLGLHPTADEIIQGNNLQIGIRVSDLKKATSDLMEKGLRMQPNKNDQANLNSFCDPDGNILYLIEI